MALSSPIKISFHEDETLFREAVRHTARKTGLNAALVEKDYFCSVLLADLCAGCEEPPIFKGGTSLSKIHADFYRLSEDLDFGISLSPDATRSDRSRMIAPVKEWVLSIEKKDPIFKIEQKLIGFNNSKQYVAQIAYPTFVSSGLGRIKIEVGLREEILIAPVMGSVRTLLENPFTGMPEIREFETTVLTREETYAEKLRAALTRREPAIRDFYDIDYAVSNLNLDLENPRLIDLVKKKLQIPGNDEVDVTGTRKKELISQLETQLKPVLRSIDYDAFDFEKAFRMISDLARKITG
jgi:predicted nucleotidyltransferase component of viral defense system